MILARLGARDIEIFDALLRLGTATAAASSLGTSQPAVSRAIAELERVTGLKLFVRGARLTPTPEAIMLHREVARHFTGLHRIAEAARDLALERRGNVAVVAPPALAYGLLADAIAIFAKTRPQITIEVDIQSSATASSWISDQRFDIGLATYGRAFSPAVHAEPFAALMR